LIDRTDIQNMSLSDIDANQFPYLKLKYYAKDEILRTSSDLQYWRILYEGLPESAINSNSLFTFYNDTLQQGEVLELELAVENISDYDMDSLLVRVSVVDDLNNQTTKFTRYEPLEKGQMVNTKFSINTKDFSDTQQLIMEVNPDEDQPELHHFNNLLVQQFHVIKDKINPLLDVTFDGTHIMSGDIVSPKPKIQVSLTDENLFLSLSDTSLFKIFIKEPNKAAATLIPFTSEFMTFIPAIEGSDNQAFIELNPNFTTDGEYELLVQSEDATGNSSGNLDYKVVFKIITRSAISNVLNYPNPFSTSTQFVYTLTGDEIPEYFKIQIFTVSGKVIREITQDEIGPLKVGTHRTDYRWDGTDEYGGRLANGVYLYRVVATKTGQESYESFDNGTNRFFRKEFGKMTILR